MFLAQAGLALLASGLLLPGPSGSPKEEDSDGPEEILSRFELRRDQRGDSGRVDAEKRLAATRAEYEQRRARRGRAQPLGIGGTRWISIGPTNGAGRMTAVAPHPTRTGTVYAGAAGGGVWKTEDSGATWRPLTEDLPDLSVGALAIAPSSPETIYLGTGEGGFGRFIPGIGFLTSRDGGETWNLPSTVLSRSFFRISVHPARPDEIVAGTESGGARSTDGGRTWNFVIPSGTWGAVTEVLRSPADPAVLYAATWCGLGCATGASRVLKSADGGATWASKSAGLPVSVADPFLERLSLAISRSDPRVLYAATSLADGGFPVSHVFKTVDGGESWADLESVWNSDDENVPFYLGQQSWYDNTLTVSPTSPETVVAGGVLAIRSTDGGASWSARLDPGFHVDQHDFQYQDSTLWVANDGGIFTSADDGATFVGRNRGLVTRQYYALGNDLSHRNRVVAGSQDNGTGQRTDAGGTDWREILGADGFDCASSPLAPNLLYATIQRGRIFRARDAGAPDVALRGISPPYEADEEAPFRTLLALDPGEPTTIYTGSWRVWRSRDAGDNWVPMPAETSDGVPWPETEVTALALAPAAAGSVWVAKGGTVFRSSDSGQTWRAAGVGLPGARINGLEADPRDPLTAYAALATTTGVAVYRTSDGGARWEARSAGLPHFAAMVVRVDPTDSNVLFCGTDVGVFRSTDRGGNWARFGTDLPAVSVHDLRISEDASIVRIATHGRGAWELEVPPPENRPPAAALVAPGGSATVALGAIVEFSSRVTDEDAGDSLRGVWTFPDTWETLETRGGNATVTHTFRRTGVFPVSLTARDAAGATATSFVTITVAEPADDCRRPVVVPGGGPFPVTVLVNNESATSQASDPAAACVFEGAGVFGSVWLEFTPASTDFYDVTTCGAPADTVLTAFTGPACGPYAPVANGCDDDVGAGGSCARTTSRLTLYAVAGETLRLQLTGFFEAERARTPVTIRPSSGPAAPEVHGLDVRVGPAGGGTVLLVSGANFAPGASVSFGGAPASQMEVLGPTRLSAVAPPHAPGVVDVAVRAADGSSGRLLAAFTYVEAAPDGPCGSGGEDCPDRNPRVLRPRR
jgi:photosystem II stability/assembly factor-like uncharacterized protein